MNVDTNLLAILVKPQDEDVYFGRLVSELNKGLHKEVLENNLNEILDFGKNFLNTLNNIKYVLLC